LLQKHLRAQQPQNPDNILLALAAQERVAQPLVRPPARVVAVEHLHRDGVDFREGVRVVMPKHLLPHLLQHTLMLLVLGEVADLQEV
jgi:hypothetical protein